jgi:hypothetical protein
MINPRGVKIVANTVGFFIANDAEEVRRANAFCKVRKLLLLNYLLALGRAYKRDNIFFF